MNIVYHTSKEYPIFSKILFMKRILLLLFTQLICISFLSAQDITKPSEFLGYELGTTFSRHHQVMDYFQTLTNEKSDQVKLINYGKTNENRPLYLAFVSSPENIENLEKIRENHLKNAGLVDGESSSDIAVVWLSYNVHGNEASSTEASMLTLYELLTEKQDWLKNTLVIIDPCVNPDGRDRYVNWYNQTGNKPFNPDPQAREHDEPWPNGRPNHYLFDLNRDWAWATQVETQARLKQYNQWMPHIHVDFHEQGINEPYYFAPAAKPFHEIITSWQREFQTQIGKNHAKYFDAEGWYFFTRERFDLFYPSYGDTYPTYMGAIGMTYEQAGNGSAGLGILTRDNDTLTLTDRIAHHTTTGLSTVEIASKNAEKLNQEFSQYFQNEDLNYKSFVVNGHPEKLTALKTLLDRHEIKYAKAEKQRLKGYDYNSAKTAKMSVENSALVIHTDQPKGKMVKALFEPQAKLEDSLTYDITAWSLPYAHGLDAVASTSKVKTTEKNEDTYTPVAEAYAYVCEWNSMADAKFLSELLQNGFKVRFTEKPFQSNGESFKAGALIITKADNTQKDDFIASLNVSAMTHKIQLKPIISGFSETAPDIGSPDVKLIHQPKIAVLSGEDVSSLSFGEVWHFLETQLHYPFTALNLKDIANFDLGKYDVIILPNGNYKKTIDKEQLKKLQHWVKEGGRVIAIQNALKAFANQKGFGLKAKTTKKKDSIQKAKETKLAAEELDREKLIPYAKRERDAISKRITGAIFKAEIDHTHPLAFGYDKTYFTLKLSSNSYDLIDKAYNVGYITDPKVYSGFAGHKALPNQKNSLLLGEERQGKGSFIYVVDNVLFRSFWENGKLFMVNALFFVNND